MSEKPHTETLPNDRAASDPEQPHSESSDSVLESSNPENGNSMKTDGERTIRGIKWILTVFAILSSTFLFALDTTVVSPGSQHPS